MVAKAGAAESASWAGSGLAPPRATFPSRCERKPQQLQRIHQQFSWVLQALLLFSAQVFEFSAGFLPFSRCCNSSS